MSSAIADEEKVPADKKDVLKTLRTLDEFFHQLLVRIDEGEFTTEFGDEIEKFMEALDEAFYGLSTL